MDEHPAAELKEPSKLAQLESILFVASGPVTTGRLASALDMTNRQVEKLLDTLAESYADRGLTLQWGQDKSIQLTELS